MSGASSYRGVLSGVLLAYLAYIWLPSVTWYQISTSAQGVYDLVNLPEHEVEACAKVKPIKAGGIDGDC